MVDEFEFFLEKEWSDGMPVVTPTEERVQRMLTGTRRHADDVLGHIPPMLEPATVRTVAIHAVTRGYMEQVVQQLISSRSWSYDHRQSQEKRAYD